MTAERRAALLAHWQRILGPLAHAVVEAIEAEVARERREWETEQDPDSEDV